jgi:A/G-specific adenine glycosylase
LEPKTSSPALKRVGSLAPDIRLLLLGAYDSGKRDLPWREETDPYRIWVSEVMLQQTRVETVLPYYKEWMARFPDLGALADAEEDQVLRVWQGLGYYSRARRLWGGAKVVRERFGGRLPETTDELKSLPGVGEYTAGAVASIAYGEVVPAVDGNVRRVLSRLFDLPDPGTAELRALAGELVDPKRPGDFNQALMEHGALVCTPQSPTCQECSLVSHCQAHEVGSVPIRPERKGKRAVPERHYAVLVAVCLGTEESGSDDPRFLLRRRPEKGLLARLWEFPGVEMEATEMGPVTEGAKGRGRAHLSEVWGEVGMEGPIATAEPPLPLPSVPHQFSHLKAVYWPWVVQLRKMGEVEGRWASLEESRGLPLPVAQGKILESALNALSETEGSE